MERNISQGQLAHYLGITRRHLSDIENQRASLKNKYADEEQEEPFKAGVQKYIAEGLRLDDALKLAEWDEKYAALLKKLVALETGWETLKDSTSLREVADFYHRAHDATHEANSLTLYAEMNLGRVLNEMERDYLEEYQKMKGNK
jgi:transcriptional regulator with XRE-family HTH domain